MYRNTGFRATLSYILAIVASMLTFGRELVSLIGGVAVVIKITRENFPKISLGSYLSSIIKVYCRIQHRSTKTISFM